GQQAATAETAAPAGTGGPAWRIAGALIVSLYGLLVVFLLVRLFVYPFLQTSDHAANLGAHLSAMPFFTYLILIFFMVIFHSVLTGLLAYPLTARTLPGRGAYKALLWLFVAAGPM